MTDVYSDDILTAFLDGELPPREADEIRAAAQTDPKLDEQLKSLALDTGMLKVAFNPVIGVAKTRNLEHRLECALSHDVANLSGPPSGWQQLALYSAAAIVGAALSWTLLQPTSDWRTEVAHYQALYVADTLANIQPNTERLTQEFVRAGTALNLDLDPQDFTGIDGLILRRAQVLGFEGAPLVQIAFTTPNGKPVAFCILKLDGVATKPETESLVGLPATSWSTKTHRFLTIGGVSPAEVMKFANQLRQRI